MITAKTSSGEWVFTCETLPIAVSLAKKIAKRDGHRKLILRDGSGRVVLNVYCVGGDKAYASAPSGISPK